MPRGTKIKKTEGKEKVKKAPKKKTAEPKLTISTVYELLSKRIESLEGRLSQVEKHLPLKAVKEILLSQLEFDNLVYHNYLNIRERPKQPVSLIRLWEKIKTEEDISWESFSKMLLRSQDPRFHLVEGKAEMVVEDKQARRYYSNIIGN